MSALFGAGPDIDEQKDLEKRSKGAYDAADPNVQRVDFGHSAMGGYGPEGRNATLDAIQGYRDIVNAPGGLDARAQEALTSTRLATDAETNARMQGIQDQAARRGDASAGDAMAMQAIATQQGANRNAEAGTRAAALGEEARQAALSGEAGAGAALRAGDVNEARTKDAYEMQARLAEQQQLQENFRNALAKAGGYRALMSDYNGTKAGGGYGLLGNGLLSSVAGGIGGVAGAMTGGVSNLIGGAGSLISQLNGGGFAMDPSLGGGLPYGAGLDWGAGGAGDESAGMNLGGPSGYDDPRALMP